MKTLVYNILRAAFVVPFTTGLVKERRNGGFSVHDGSIAGVVLLTTTVIIIFETIYVLSTASSKLLMIGLLCIGIAALVFCSFMVRHHSQWRVLRTVAPSDKLKFKFLLLFCLGNIAYQALTLAMHIECKIYEDVLQISLYFGITWLFHILQTTFIYYFSRFRFVNFLSLYYSLVILFITNISMWTQQTISSYKVVHIPLDLNVSSDIDSPCENDTTLLSATIFLKPYLEPVVLEYCLLSLIFISEMWPKEIVHNDRTEIQEAFSTEYEASVDSQMSLSGEIISYLHVRSSWNRASIITLTIGAIYSASFIIIQCILIYIPETRSFLSVTSFSYFFLGNCVRTALLIKCFYAFSSQLQPTVRPGKLMNLNHFIILASSVATCGYYCVEIITLTRLSNSFDEIKNIVNALIRIVATILQTIFILQMKQYRKTGNSRSILSIENTFLFLSCINFGIWFSYTFVSHRYRNKLNQTTIFEHSWFPLVIFYHFECFFSFYKLFRQ